MELEFNSDLRAEIVEAFYKDESIPVSEKKEIATHEFSQTWPSTALGYEGIGGHAITTAITVVIESSEFYYVYFNRGKLAYRVPVWSEDFKEDLLAHNLKDTYTIKRLNCYK